MIIGIALNPESGAGRAEKYRSQLLKVVEEYPIDVVWLAAENAEEALTKMRSAVMSGELDALVVVGGDGMIHFGVEAVGDSGIPLGIVAAGSGNDIAREFKLPIHNMEDSLHQVITSLFARRYYEVDALEIESAEGIKRAMAIVSLGLDADVNERTNRMKWPRGNLRYVRAIGQSVRNYQPYGVKISANGHTGVGSMTLLCVANTRYAGGGFALAPRAKPNDGLLDVVIARGLTLAEFGSLLPKLAVAKHTADERVHCFRTSEITVEADTCYGEHPPAVMADGEYICKLPATIRVRPRAIKLAL
ncbi:diacylglycerol/lipid kinase family protein [Arcanobacterium bovis]|uniref:Diacylglycerol kinase family lipid kinase n=1 Tax=Arcanobacterium bovis TaxID=2529275 RepID=A0A4Q9V1G8_9ACTO|nr:diacylglycerol kinase family protein [Arcanobacterium bovis]TBW22931.1 diacylglycerol kinase family lipid kinase [Arcanobacterium bovis]